MTEQELVEYRLHYLTDKTVKYLYKRIYCKTTLATTGKIVCWKDKEGNIVNSYAKVTKHYKKRLPVVTTLRCI